MNTTTRQNKEIDAMTVQRYAKNAEKSLTWTKQSTVYAPIVKKPAELKRKKKIRSLFSEDRLGLRCRSTIQDLFRNGQVHGVKGEQYSFIDNGAKVLAVAHCDFVAGNGKHVSVAPLKTDTLIFSPMLDDRLGVYTVLDLLPKLGIKVDVLLTENEEIGRSTASMFDTIRQYNWMVEFDRRGTDAVCYNYDLEHEIGEHFRVGNGSFSDICSLDHLGCMGFNVGVGYYEEHSERCYMSVNDYVNQMSKFVSFWKANKDTHHIHEQTDNASAYGRYYKDEYDKTDWFMCGECGCEFMDWETIASVDTIVCPQCGLNIKKDDYKTTDEIPF